MKSNLTYDQVWSWEINGIGVTLRCNKSNPLHINPYIHISQGDNELLVSVKDLEDIVIDVKNCQLLGMNKPK